MSRPPEIDQIIEGILLDLDMLRQEEDSLQDLEARCIDADERARINRDWNRLEEHQSTMIRHGIAVVRMYRKTVNGVLGKIVASEPSYADVKALANANRAQSASQSAA